MSDIERLPKETVVFFSIPTDKDNIGFRNCQISDIKNSVILRKEKLASFVTKPEDEAKR